MEWGGTVLKSVDIPGRVSVSQHEVHVSIRRYAHHPLLLAGGCLEAKPQVPWLGARRLPLEIR